MWWVCLLSLTGGLYIAGWGWKSQQLNAECWVLYPCWFHDCFLQSLMNWDQVIYGCKHLVKREIGWWNFEMKVKKLKHGYYTKLFTAPSSLLASLASFWFRNPPLTKLTLLNFLLTIGACLYSALLLRHSSPLPWWFFMFMVLYPSPLSCGPLLCQGLHQLVGGCIVQEYKQSNSHILIISQCLLSSLSSNSPNFLTRLSLDPICLLHQVCPHCRATSTELSF